MVLLPAFIIAATVWSAHALPTGCNQGKNCQLPDCFCPTFEHPGLSVQYIPQMVYFGFDDALTGQVEQFYRQLFTSRRRNPNGCPITMSLYVQDEWTSYSLVSSEYRRGNEIGSHSVTHQNVDTEEKMVKEAGGQKENLVKKGWIPAHQVVGWRSPNLKPAGNATPEVLQALGYTYDISLTHTRLYTQDPIPWPFTLDFGYPYRCSVPPCPKRNSSYPGFWEIPVNSLFDPMTGYPCVYVDACRPKDEDAAFEFLRSNFEKVYTSNRAPFGLNMHAAWFFTRAYLKATHRFLDYILQRHDVYVISAKQVLDWMRNPVKTSEAHTFPAWGCDSPTFIPATTKAPSISGTTSTTTDTNTVTSTTPVTPTGSPTVTTTLASNPTPASSATSVPEHVSSTVMSSTQRQPATVTSSSTSRHPEIVTSTSQDPLTARTCLQEVNCRLPSCQCRSFLPPGGLSLEKTPQIVYLTFIGGIDGLNFSPIRRLITNVGATNPNGCPISATFFVPLRGNYLPYVQGLRNDGHEIAMYGSDSAAYRLHAEEKLSRELSLFDGLNTTEGITAAGAGSVQLGFRSPAVSSLGTTLFKALSENDVLYDSSLVTSRTTSLRDVMPWPHTLDFGWEERCASGAQCNTGRHPGLWEIPIVPVVDHKKQFVCTYADACYNQPRTAQDTFQLFSQNLNNLLDTNRAPMGIHLRKEWFSHAVYRPNLLGLQKFLIYALSRGDVYVTSVEKMLDWLRNPTGLDRAESWKC